VRRRGALALALGLALGLTAPPARAQAPAVSFSAQAIEASNPKTPGRSDIDAGLLGELRSTFQFTQYRTLGTARGSAPVGRAWSASFAGAGLTLEVTPRSVEGSTITVDARLVRGGAPVVTSTLRIASGGKVLLGGPTIAGGRIIVVLTAR